jgi:hypothetical protein
MTGKLRQEQPLRIRRLCLILPARLRTTAAFDARRIAEETAFAVFRATGANRSETARPPGPPPRIRLQLDGGGHTATGLAHQIAQAAAAATEKDRP